MIVRLARAPSPTTRSRPSTWAPTTTSPSRSRSRSCWPGSAPPRAERGREEPDLVVEVAGLRLDLTDSRATRDGEEVHLTPTEWRIVDVLARRRGRLVRQAELLTAVWGPAYDTQTNYLRVHMASIRRKLEADPGRPVLFLTEPGMGYRFTAGG